MDRTRTSRWTGLDVVVIFLVFAAAMACFVATALLFPGRLLDAMWRLNPDARTAFQSMGRWSSLLLFTVGAVAAGGAIGIHQRRRFGWWLAVLLFGANGIGDTVSIVVQKQFWQGGSGVLIAGLFLFYLTRRSVRHQFERAG